jgi:hypothetical protein
VQFPINDYTLRLVLPEGATVVSTDAGPLPAPALSSSRRFTYLDGPFLGRPIVVIHARDVVSGPLGSGGPHAGSVSVTFTLPPGSLWYKPGYLVAAFAALFLLITVASRVDLSLAPTGAGAAKVKKA